MRETSHAHPGERLQRSTTEPERDPGELEERLTAIWREVLGIPDLGLDDNFLDHGVRSILLIRAHHRLVRELGHEIGVVMLFRYPTIRSLARFLSAGEEHDTSGDLLAQRRTAGRQRLDAQRSLRRTGGSAHAGERDAKDSTDRDLGA